MRLSSLAGLSSRSDASFFSLAGLSRSSDASKLTSRPLVAVVCDVYVHRFVLVLLPCMYIYNSMVWVYFVVAGREHRVSLLVALSVSTRVRGTNDPGE